MRNADLVITMEPRRGDGALGLVRNGDVLIEDDRITAGGQGAPYCGTLHRGCGAALGAQADHRRGSQREGGRVARGLRTRPLENAV